MDKFSLPGFVLFVGYFMDIYQKIQQLQKERRACALVTVVKTKGSVPREAGSKMIVEADGTIYGSIGGSTVEAMVIKEAQDVIRTGKPRLTSHDLYDKKGEDTGMLCGGMMEFFIEPLNSAERLYIFGGGHVGYHLARMAAMVGFEYVVIDDRPEFANAERFPQAAQCIVEAPAKMADQLTLGENDYAVIVTPGHAHDYEVLRNLIRKPARYIGLIASKVKRRDIYSQLMQNDGITESELQRVHCPIGLHIKAETPEEIAVSILAELIQVRRGKEA